MKKRIIAMVAIAILLVPVFGGTIVAYGASEDEYVSDVKIVSGESEEDVLGQLREAGYQPVLTNLAAEKPELAAPFVYLGYKTTKDPSRAMEITSSGTVGSVFGDSALMIGGVAMIIGVVIGMISMKVKPQVKQERGREK